MGHIKTVKGDLFSADDSYYFAHCVSADYALGAGIAKQFRDRMNMREKLFLQHDNPKVGSAYLVDNVFNLVTKERYFQKPTYESLCRALIDMVVQCVPLGINKIAMPKIGCGLDKLDWNAVRAIIEATVWQENIEIVVYEL